MATAMSRSDAFFRELNSTRPGTFSRPRLFAILNLTPDSFSDGGLHDAPEAAAEFAAKLVADGTDATRTTSFAPHALASNSGSEPQPSR